MILVQITIARNSIRRINEVIATRPSIVSPDDPIKEVKNGEIIFDDVFFSYSGDLDKSVLKNINLKINSGDYVGMIGPTGSGKSTLISLIARLFDPQVGLSMLEEKTFATMTFLPFVTKFPVVLQKNQLFTGTLRDNSKVGWRRPY